MTDGNGTQRELGSLDAKVDILLQQQNAIFTKVNRIETDVATLKVKTTVWSGLSGVIGGVLAYMGFQMGR